MSNPTQQNDDVLHLPLDDQRGPARRLTAEQSDALVEAVLGAAYNEKKDPAPVRRLTLRWSVLLAASLAVATASAAVGVWVARSERAPPSEPVPAVNEPAPSPSVRRSARRAQPPPSADETSATVAGAEGVPPSPVRPEVRGGRGSASSSAPAVRAAELLSQANTLRASRDWIAAERTYVEVTTLFPETAESYVATVAAAALALEHLGQPAVAVERYRRALELQPAGPLSVEIRIGLVNAYRGVGDEAAEARALREFLAAHADSPYAQRVRDRLEQIPAGTP